MQRLAGLAQREVERRGLVGPDAVELRHLARWGASGKRSSVARCSENERIVQSPASASVGPGLLGDLVVDGVVDDVLAEALLAGAVQVDDRRLALEVAGDVLHEPLELVALDGDGQVGDEVVGAHGLRGYRPARVRPDRTAALGAQPTGMLSSMKPRSCSPVAAAASALVACARRDDDAGAGARRRRRSAGSFVVGIGEQNSPMFADQRFRDLGIKHARLVVPYDAAARPERARRSSTRGCAAPRPPAPSRSSRSATRARSPKKLPSVAEFRAAFDAFHKRYPDVRGLRAVERDQPRQPADGALAAARGRVLQRRQGASARTAPCSPATCSTRRG